MAEYRLTPASEQDLEAIWLSTLHKWDVAQAIRYTDILTAAFAELAQSPMIAPACEHIRPGYRRQRVVQHMVYFRMTDYGIAIIRILHDSMDAPSHL